MNIRNIAKKALILTLITLLNGSILQAMYKKYKIIEFYEKGNKDSRDTDHNLMGFVVFNTLSLYSATIEYLYIENTYANKNFMKLFMLYTAAYIFRTNQNIETIEFIAGAGENGRPAKSKLIDIYKKTGASFDGKLFKFAKNTLKNSWFKEMLKIKLEENSQILKGIYVKVIDENLDNQSFDSIDNDNHYSTTKSKL